MPTYRYEVQRDGGELAIGDLAAASVTAAAGVLREQGGRIIRITPQRRSGVSIGKRVRAILLAGSGPTKANVLDFTTQLAVMIRAGISLHAAIDGIASQVKTDKFRQVLLAIQGELEAGAPFSEAIASHPRLFNPLYVNMVRASEMSGAFGRMLDRIAAIIARQIETRKMVIGASLYPMVIGMLATTVTIFLLTFVLPRFAGVFAGKEALLPWPTIFLMALSGWMEVWWWTIPLAMVAVATGTLIASRTEQGGSFLDRWKLRLPVFRRMLRALYINRSLQTLGELLNAGVPLVNALRVTGDITGNCRYRELWHGVGEGVREGRRINEILSETPLLPRPVVQMIAAGEESGRLGDVLEEISEYYDRVLRDAIKTFTSLLEPLMIVVMGMLVGFIAMAIILPIFKMSSVVTGG